MGRINLRSLIDEVLEMVKHKQNEDKRLRSDQELARTNMSWDDTPAGQAYWKDIRGRNTDMEKQGLVNQGALGLARENNAGSMARARLEAETETNLGNLAARTETNLRNLAARVENQKTTNDFNIRKYEIDRTKKESGLGKEHIAGLTAIIGDMNAPDEDKAMARQLLLGGFRTNKDQPQVGGGQQQGVLPPQQGQPALTVRQPKEPDGLIAEKKPSLIGRTRTDNPDDYNIFGTKKAPYMSDFIDHSGPAPAEPIRKKKISDMNENEVISEQNIYNKKYGVNIRGKRFTLPFTPTSPMDEWRKSKYGE